MCADPYFTTFNFIPGYRGHPAVEYANPAGFAPMPGTYLWNHQFIKLIPATILPPQLITKAEGKKSKPIDRSYPFMIDTRGLAIADVQIEFRDPKYSELDSPIEILYIQNKKIAGKLSAKRYGALGNMFWEFAENAQHYPLYLAESGGTYLITGLPDRGFSISCTGLRLERPDAEIVKQLQIQGQKILQDYFS